MKTHLITACLVVGAIIAPIAVRAADGDSDRTHPTAFVKDSVITTKVKSKLAADKIRSLAQIHVDTDRNGMVVLSGRVESEDAFNAAASIARDTEGVTSVQNHIKVKKAG
jgi:hyperosmotically inducible protein